MYSFFTARILVQTLQHLIRTASSHLLLLPVGYCLMPFWLLQMFSPVNTADSGTILVRIVRNVAYLTWKNPGDWSPKPGFVEHRDRAS